MVQPAGDVDRAVGPALGDLPAASSDAAGTSALASCIPSKTGLSAVPSPCAGSKRVSGAGAPRRGTPGVHPVQRGVGRGLRLDQLHARRGRRARGPAAWSARPGPGRADGRAGRRRGTPASTPPRLAGSWCRITATSGTCRPSRGPPAARPLTARRRSRPGGRVGDHCSTTRRRARGSAGRQARVQREHDGAAVTPEPQYAPTPDARPVDAERGEAAAQHVGGRQSARPAPTCSAAGRFTAPGDVPGARVDRLDLAPVARRRPGRRAARRARAARRRRPRRAPAGARAYDDVARRSGRGGRR